jgi:hypothetical protein
MAKYLLLIYGDEEKWEAWSEAEQEANSEAHAAFNAFAGASVIGGHELQRSRTAASVRADSEGRPSTADGPFLQTKQALGGFYIVEAANLDAAISLAERLPEASADSSGVEVRPVQTMD